MNRYAAIILAAGRGSRYAAAGGLEATKLVAPYRGEPLVRHVARTALFSAADPVIVVTGHASAVVGAAVAGLDVRIVNNPDFAEGLASSLQAGLAAMPHDAEGAVILLGDMPNITASTIDALISRAGELPQVDAVVPVHEGSAGNPVLLNRSLHARLAMLTGDQGARRLLKTPSVAVAEIAQPPSVLFDVDRPKDLEGTPEQISLLRRDD